MEKIVGILLAAGSSRRFGSDKLCRLTPEKQPVAVQACHSLLEATDKLVAVIRPGADELAEMLEKTGASILTCQNAEEGMGTSLAYGISVSLDADGWIIALADMPWIKPATINKVSSALRSGAKISVPFHNGKRGHPVGFSHLFREELLALSGDKGAKILLEKYGSQIQPLDCDDPGILLDIDVPSDLIDHSKLMTSS